MLNESVGIQSFTNALALADEVVADCPDNREYRELQARLTYDAGRFYVTRAHYRPDYRSPAEMHMRRADELYTELSRAYPEEHGYLDEHATALAYLLRVLRYPGGTPSERAALVRRSIALMEQAENPDWNNLHLTTKAVAPDTPDQRADALYRRALAVARIQGAPEGTRSERWFFTHLLRSAGLHMLDRYPEESEALLREAVDRMGEVLGDFPSLPLYQEHMRSCCVALATCLVSQGRRNEVDAEYADYIDRFPYADGLRRERIRRLKSRGHREEALSLVRGELARFPENWAFHELHATLLKEQADPETALRDLNDQIAQFPEVSCYYRWRGELYNELGDHEAALQNLNRAVNLLPDRRLLRQTLFGPGDAITFRRRGQVLDALGQHDLAVEDYTTCIQDYGASEPYRYRAYSQFRQGNFREALADLRLAVERNIADLHHIPTVEIVNCPDDEFRERFLELVDETVQRNDGSPDVLLARARVLAEFGKVDRVRADLLQAVGQDDADYYTTYRAALLALRLREDAVYRTLCQRMVTEFADSEAPTETHFTAWTCALAPNALDDYELAIQLARHALEKEPKSQQYINGLGAILLRAGRYDVAKEKLEQALAAGESDNTSTSYIRYFLAMTEQHLGNDDAAQEQLKAANTTAEAELAGSPVWNRKLTLQVLREEAESLIEAKPAAAGDEQEPSPSPQENNNE